ncbi:hypothetical protein K0504_17125 [Neiella marina]|uniref:Pullulanase n=1 Tax=Neiella holothuriorum TaxID=2870530 RepID=A0ABS7EK90_9GAMM|nr:hypothetical protein [Neiella holothuriorum]MBW8192763.1 hypothetical protein [Neiella holothuriorum]
MRLSHLVPSLAITAALCVVSGCQSTAKTDKQEEGSPSSAKSANKVAPPKAPSKPSMDQILYLRGVFTWWDAEEPYKVKRVGPDLYQAQARLVADGEYYDFKFADAGWSPGTNCGFLTKADENVLEDAAPVNANCSSNGSYFRFKPTKTGTFGFYFDQRNETPQVYIKRL